MIEFNIDNSFTRELPGDPIRSNHPRQVINACYSYVNPTIPKKPELIAANLEVANLLGISNAEVNSSEFLNIFSGTHITKTTEPYAMCYGGHQFGHWAGQLGDGRAINLMEILNNGNRWQLQLKGAGPTPYRRSADGLAVLRSSIREYLMSEAMHNLGIPTTRALSLMLSGEEVMRDMLYDGNPGPEKGAIVCRVAPSFMRFGNFQILAARQDFINLKKLTDYSIKYFYPELGNPSKQSYIELFRKISQLTMEMIIHWQRVGFVHGVMNTDNMSILGLTIDYGPYGWMDNYDPDWTPNTTDAQTKRYRFSQQAYVGQWNLAQLANALYPLIEEKDELISILNEYREGFQQKYDQMMSSKLGLMKKLDEDLDLILRLEHLLPRAEVDSTIFFRNLSIYSKELDVYNTPNSDLLQPIEDAFYQYDKLDESLMDQWIQWIISYLNRLKEETLPDEERRRIMNNTNPKYVLRNYMAQMAIDKADQEDYSLIYELENLLKNPYDEQAEYQKWFAKRPDWARSKAGCSMLSCSS